MDKNQIIRSENLSEAYKIEALNAQRNKKLWRRQVIKEYFNLALVPFNVAADAIEYVGPEAVTGLLVGTFLLPTLGVSIGLGAILGTAFGIGGGIEYFKSSFSPSGWKNYKQEVKEGFDGSKIDNASAKLLEAKDKEKYYLNARHQELLKINKIYKEELEKRKVLKK